jgi:N-carbamoylputrescine amidase
MRSVSADVYGLGELFSAPYFALERDPKWNSRAEDLDGPTVTWMRAMSVELNAVVFGSVFIAPCWNMGVFVEGGEVLGTYTKAHIPHGDNDSGSFFEGFYFRPSPRFVPTVVETSVGRLGASICYDRHFEGVHRALARAGAQLILSPAITFGRESQRMWPMEFQVDAARNRVFIAGSNRLGTEPPWNQPYYGGSLLAGPQGLVAADRSVPGVVQFSVELSQVATDSGWKLVEDARW